MRTYKASGCSCNQKDKKDSFILKFLMYSYAFWISGCSFIVPPKAIPGRLTLLVTLFLLQMQIVKDVQGILPDSDSLTGKKIHSKVVKVI